MSLYMYQFKYTRAAWAGFAKKPEDRRPLVDELLKKLGGKLVAVYYTFGEWDGLVIYEAPNEITAMAAVVAILTPGHLEATKTTVLFTVEDAIKAMSMASSLTFRGIEPLPSAWPA